MQENSAIVAKPKLEKDFYNWHQRHKAILKLIKTRKQVDLIFMGDSVTHMFGGEPKSSIAIGQETWDKFYGERNTINMGFGWDRTQNVLWRIEHGELDGVSPKVLVLLIGTNNLTATKNARANSPEEIADAISLICEKVHEKLPTTKILLLSVLPRKNEKNVEDIRKINRLLSKAPAKDYVTYLDMTAQFADKDGQFRDDLRRDDVHPNKNGYKVWAETMEPTLKQLLGEK